MNVIVCKNRQVELPSKQNFKTILVLCIPQEFLNRLFQLHFTNKALYADLSMPTKLFFNISMEDHIGYRDNCEGNCKTIFDRGAAKSVGDLASAPLRVPYIDNARLVDKLSVG